jgi:hypothetical protein
VIASPASRPPLRRLFGTVTAVRADLLPPELQARVPSGATVPRYELRDRIVKGTGLDFDKVWTTAVARGRAIEWETINRTTETLADAVITNGGEMVRDVRESAEAIVDDIASRLPGGTNPSIQQQGKAAIGAALTTPLTKAGIASDVVFSAATGVAEAALRGVKADDAEGHVDTATAITYEAASGIAAGAVGTLVGTVATPVGGIAAAIATKLGIDAIRDPIVWKCTELVAGVRAAFSR